MKNNYLSITLLFCSTLAHAQEMSLQKNAQDQTQISVAPQQRKKKRISALPLPKIPKTPPEKQLPVAPANIDPEILYNQVKQLLQSHNIVPVVEVLKNIPSEDVKKIVIDIMNDTAADAYYKTALLFALAATPELAQLQDFFFSLIETPETKEGYPIIWIATESEISQKAIPPFLQYIGNTENKEHFGNIVEKAISRTIDENDTETFAIIQPLVTISPEQATQFLWRVVKENKNSEFVDLLKKMGAIIDNVQEVTHTDRPIQQTPLMLATESNQVKLVRALLNAGAHSKFSPAGDSIDARFIALDKGFTEIQEMMSDYNS